jgi:hypothetical protein
MSFSPFTAGCPVSEKASVPEKGVVKVSGRVGREPASEVGVEEK